MSTLHTLLTEADPLRYEHSPLDGHRENLRRAIIAEATANDMPAHTVPSRRVALLAAVAVTVLIGAWSFWSGMAMPVQAAMRFEIRLAEEQPSPGLFQARVVNTDEVIYLHNEVVVSNGDIAQSNAVPDSSGYAVSVTFTPTGAEKIRQATSGHLGKRIAIVLDGEVVMAPRIRSVVSDSAVITGMFDAAGAERIATGISIP